MFTQATLQTCLAGLVGFFQPDDPEYPNVYDELTQADSGIRLQNVHALCSLENIHNVAPEFSNFDYPAWTDVPAYALGARVTESSKVYQALVAIAAGTNQAPSATPLSWKEIDAFSEWLKRIYGQAVTNLMLTVAREKKLQTSARALIESQQLYTGFGALVDKIVKRGRFVGFEINASRAEGLIVRLDRIGVQVDTAQSPLTLYLYNSSSAEPVATFAVPVTRLNSFSWHTLTDAVLGYMHGDTDPDSTWYLGYYEDDIQGQFITKRMDLHVAPCASCDSYNINAYNAWSKYTSIRAIEIGTNDVDMIDRNIWDYDKITYVTNTNWGLNLSLTVSCDLAPIACTNKLALADALSQQLALEFMQRIAFNTRLNAVSDKTKQLAMAELDDEEKSGSFKAQYIKAVRALSLDLSGLNSVCMPCSNKGQITQRTV